jgi:hypothetical protein
MTQRKKYSKFGKRYMIQNVLLFTPLILPFVIVMKRWIKEDFDFVFWSCLVLFCMGVIGGLLWERYRLINIRCPECGRIIPEPTLLDRKAGDPINYYCQNCDVEWETTLHEADISP